MPADRKQVEEAVERLRAQVSRGEVMALCPGDDIRFILTDHAALLAQVQAERSRAEGWKRSAEAAEAALRGIGIAATAAGTAHQPPAPVKAGGD